MMEEGIVYILTNPAIPGLVKIGMTTRDQIEHRMQELYTTGVPVPFDCAFAGKVQDVKKVERAFHKAFGPYRINPSREFFEIEPYQAIGLLELMCTEDVTPQLNEELDKVDDASKEAGERMTQSRRQKFNFKEMGISEGELLRSIHNDETCVVLGEREVEFRGERMSLTRATKINLDNNYNVAPGPYWTYKGRKFTDIYNETYPME